MKCTVVGKSKFTSKKTGNECYVANCNIPYTGDNGIGFRVREQFLSAENYAKIITIPCEVDMVFNYNGFLESLTVLNK